MNKKAKSFKIKCENLVNKHFKCGELQRYCSEGMTMSRDDFRLCPVKCEPCGGNKCFVSERINERERLRKD